MEVVIKETYEEISRAGAEVVAEVMKKKPDCVIGLATGSSPVGLYQELIKMNKAGEIDFSKVSTFNLDEYLGIVDDHPQSYRYFMNENLFDHVNIDKANTHVPDGMTKHPVDYCAEYDKMIEDAGGIDIQVLGIGRDGHIAFNEPGSSLGSRTRIKTLTAETIEDNSRFFDSPDEVPIFAITMGVGSVMAAKKCVLVANGRSKADAVQKMIEGPVSQECTASVLQFHPDTVTIIDPDAGRLLRRYEYYLWVQEKKSQLPV